MRQPPTYTYNGKGRVATSSRPARYRFPKDIRIELNLSTLRESGDVFARAERERLNGHRRLPAAGGHEAAAVADKQIRNVVTASLGIVRLRTSGEAAPSPLRWFGVNAEIIGVVTDAKYRDLREDALPMDYNIPPRLMAFSSAKT